MIDLISIIIVNYNGKKWLQKLFDSLLCQTYKNFEIILVDNGSIDDSLEFIKNNYNDERIKIVKRDSNLGFASGNNLGIKNAKGEYILLLNNDTWIENKFLESLSNEFTGSDLDVLSPIEVGYEGQYLNYSTHRTIDFFGHPHFNVNNLKLFYLQGICLFFRKTFYIETGGLDNNFFMYFEETDWFWRLNLLNKKYAIAEDIFINHYKSGTAGNGMRYNTFLWRNQNSLQMLLKNYKWSSLIWILPVYFIQNVFEILFFIINFKFKIAWSYVQGWWFSIVNFRKIMQKRKWIQDNRSVGDFEIMKKMYKGSGKLVHLSKFFLKNNEKSI